MLFGGPGKGASWEATVQAGGAGAEPGVGWGGGQQGLPGKRLWQEVRGRHGQRLDEVQRLKLGHLETQKMGCRQYGCGCAGWVTGVRAEFRFKGLCALR